MLRFDRHRIGHRDHEQIEPVDEEPERNDGDARAQPGEKRPFVGRMIGVGLDHRETPFR